MAPLLDQRVSIVTLGVAELARSRAFYEGVLGWAPMGDTRQIVMYPVGSFVLALYPHDKLAEDFDAEAGAGVAEPYHGFALAYNAPSIEEVDRLFAALKAKDVTVLKPPHKAFWGGYSGYFADPDGHAWEIAYNPYWKTDADGRPLPPA